MAMTPRSSPRSPTRAAVKAGAAGHAWHRLDHVRLEPFPPIIVILCTASLALCSQTLSPLLQLLHASVQYSRGGRRYYLLITVLRSKTLHRRLKRNDQAGRGVIARVPRGVGTFLSLAPACVNSNDTLRVPRGRPVLRSCHRRSPLLLADMQCARKEKEDLRCRQLESGAPVAVRPEKKSWKRRLAI